MASDPIYTTGCIYDEEGIGYEDNDGGDYPINHHGDCNE